MCKYYATYYADVRTRRGGSAGGGPRPFGACAGIGGVDGVEGVGVRSVGESNTADLSRSGAFGKSGVLASPPCTRPFCPGDDGGVSEARFTRSFETIDWRAAEAGERSASTGRGTSGFDCKTCVEFARGGSGGGTGRGGVGEGSPSCAAPESWSRPENPVWETGTGSLTVELAAPGFFHKR